MRNNGENIYALQHAARASRKLQEQICDPTTCITVELILAVFVFANSYVSCYVRD
jgi:hypothetical protein